MIIELLMAAGVAITAGTNNHPDTHSQCLKQANSNFNDQYLTCIKAADNADASARLEAEANEWHRAVIGAITRVWSPPSGTSHDLKAVLNLSIDSTGQVRSTTVTISSGTPAFDDSITRAIYRASPLPLPSSAAAFTPKISACFSPSKKNCL